MSTSKRKAAREYKYRAEIQYDIYRFHLRLHEHILSLHELRKQASDGQHHYSFIRDIHVHDLVPAFDSVITFETTLPLKMLLALANLLDDCHVIAETLQPAELYTGERVTR